MKSMKMLLCVLTGIICLFTMNWSVKAESLVESKEFKEIQALTDDMMEFLETQPIALEGEPITADCIHFADAVKIYIDIDWFQYKSLTPEILKKELQKASRVRITFGISQQI